MYPQLFKNYLEQGKIVTKLIKYYNPELIQEKFVDRKRFLNNLIENLKSINLDIYNDDYDEISRIYENHKEHKDRLRCHALFYNRCPYAFFQGIR